jgi:hypothetical protein
LILLLVLTTTTFGANHYLVHASAPLLYREIALDHLQRRILESLVVGVKVLERTPAIELGFV